jgi:asparagine synthase (glutamine-hydrolysing)
LKVMLRNVYADVLPQSIVSRRDKMGFPVPISEWYRSEITDFMRDTLSTRTMSERGIFNATALRYSVNAESKFSRKTWGLLSLELWFRTFIDEAATFRRKLKRQDDMAPPIKIAV